MRKWILPVWTAALVLISLVSIHGWLYTGGELFNLTGHQSALDPKGPIAANQAYIFYVTLWVTLFLFITVGGALAFTLWKFRTRAGDDPNFIPPQSHGHPLIELGLVIASTALLVVIAVPTFGGILLQKRVPEKYAADAVDINVTGYQWWFGFEYPEYGFHTANEIVFPAGRAVRLTLRANDVIHSFWIPKLAGKTDLIPGQVNTMWLKADEPGYFYGQCAEYCGDSHAYMLFRVVALSPADWDAWVARQLTQTVAGAGDYTPVRAGGGDDVLRGTALFRDHCARCHSVDSRQQTMGPNLAHFGSRTSIAAGWLENEPEHLFRWIKEPQTIKPGNFMWRGFPAPGNPREVQMEGLIHANLSDREVHDLVAYLYALQ
jgi:cytochrome c oxidase subunit II